MLNILACGSVNILEHDDERSEQLSEQKMINSEHPSKYRYTYAA